MFPLSSIATSICNGSVRIIDDRYNAAVSNDKVRQCYRVNHFFMISPSRIVMWLYLVFLLLNIVSNTTDSYLSVFTLCLSFVALLAFLLGRSRNYDGLTMLIVLGLLAAVCSLPIQQYRADGSLVINSTIFKFCLFSLTAVRRYVIFIIIILTDALSYKMLINEDVTLAWLYLYFTVLEFIICLCVSRILYYIATEVLSLSYKPNVSINQIYFLRNVESDIIAEIEEVLRPKNTVRNKFQTNKQFVLDALQDSTYINPNKLDSDELELFIKSIARANGFDNELISRSGIMFQFSSLSTVETNRILRGYYTDQHKRSFFYLSQYHKALCKCYKLLVRPTSSCKNFRLLQLAECADCNKKPNLRTELSTGGKSEEFNSTGQRDSFADESLNLVTDQSLLHSKIYIGDQDMATTKQSQPTLKINHSTLDSEKPQSFFSRLFKRRSSSNQFFPVVSNTLNSSLKMTRENYASFIEKQASNNNELISDSVQRPLWSNSLTKDLSYSLTEKEDDDNINDNEAYLTFLNLKTVGKLPNCKQKLLFLQMLFPRSCTIAQENLLYENMKRELHYRGFAHFYLYYVTNKLVTFIKPTYHDYLLRFISILAPNYNAIDALHLAATEAIIADSSLKKFKSFLYNDRLERWYYIFVNSTTGRILISAKKPIILLEFIVVIIGIDTNLIANVYRTGEYISSAYLIVYSTHLFCQLFSITIFAILLNYSIQYLSMRALTVARVYHLFACILSYSCVLFRLNNTFYKNSNLLTIIDIILYRVAVSPFYLVCSTANYHMVNLAYVLVAIVMFAIYRGISVITSLDIVIVISFFVLSMAFYQLPMLRVFRKLFDNTTLATILMLNGLSPSESDSYRLKRSVTLFSKSTNKLSKSNAIRASQSFYTKNYGSGENYANTNDSITKKESIKEVDCKASTKHKFYDDYSILSDKQE